MTAVIGADALRGRANVIRWRIIALLHEARNDAQTNASRCAENEDKHGMMSVIVRWRLRQSRCKQVTTMSRPRRYECKGEFWTTPQQMDALELLCADGLSDKATHLRQALAMYLRHCGIVAAPRPANGQHHEAAGAEQR